MVGATAFIIVVLDAVSLPCTARAMESPVVLIMWKIVFCAIVAQAMSSEDSNCTCGKPSESIFSTRIVGGRRAVPHSHPWAVPILYRGKINCGGALLTKRHVIAAGHCFVWNNILTYDNMTVAIGVDDLRDMRSVEIRNISGVIVHERFAPDEHRDENDIAVAILIAPVEYNDWIQPVCLPHPNQDFTNRTTMVVGWGQNEKGEHSNVLMQAALRVFSDEDCKRSQLGKHIVQETMMCAYSRGRDGCQGDSGGPLLAYEPSGHYVLAGIVSWGIGCGDIRFPGVYTKVSKYIDWINKNIPRAQTCE